MDSTNVKGLQRLISAPYESKILGITILYEIITRRTLIKKIDKEIKKINKPEPLISAEPPSIDIDFLGRKAIWDELKRKFSDVDYVGNDRYVFNIGGNKYRLVALINFKAHRTYVRYIGSHADYNKINCNNI